MRILSKKQTAVLENEASVKDKFIAMLKNENSCQRRNNSRVV